MCHKKTHFDKKSHDPLPENECKHVFFRGIPDPDPTTHQNRKENGDERSNYRTSEGKAEGSFEEPLYAAEGRSGYKFRYAKAFDGKFKNHLREHLTQNGPWKPQDPQFDTHHHTNTTSAITPDQHCQRKISSATREKFDHAAFVHFFGVPLFRMVAANWARLVSRRSFELDLLEWRPPYRMNSETVEEIKSRRVAITRHQRDIDASVEVLRGLTQEERFQMLDQTYRGLSKDGTAQTNSANTQLDALTLALLEVSNAQWNRGRSNGLVADAADYDSWERVFFDFFELKASMDALEKRADKIQDGIVGLIQIWSGVQSQNLNIMVIFFTLFVFPFSIVGAIWSANLTKNPSPPTTETGMEIVPSKHWAGFVIAALVTFAAVFVFLVVGWLVKGWVFRKYDKMKFWWKLWWKLWWKSPASKKQYKPSRRRIRESEMGVNGVSASVHRSAGMSTGFLRMTRRRRDESIEVSEA